MKDFNVHLFQSCVLFQHKNESKSEKYIKKRERCRLMDSLSGGRVLTDKISLCVFLLSLMCLKMAL